MENLAITNSKFVEKINELLEALEGDTIDVIPNDELLSNDVFETGIDAIIQAITK